MAHLHISYNPSKQCHQIEIFLTKIYIFPANKGRIIESGKYAIDGCMKFPSSFENVPKTLKKVVPS